MNKWKNNLATGKVNSLQHTSIQVHSFLPSPFYFLFSEFCEGMFCPPTLLPFLPGLASFLAWCLFPQSPHSTAQQHKNKTKINTIEWLHLPTNLLSNQQRHNRQHRNLHHHYHRLHAYKRCNHHWRLHRCPPPSTIMNLHHLPTQRYSNIHNCNHNRLHHHRRPYGLAPGLTTGKH